VCSFEIDFPFSLWGAQEEMMTAGPPVREFIFLKFHFLLDEELF